MIGTNSPELAITVLGGAGSTVTAEVFTSETSKNIFKGALTAMTGLIYLCNPPQIIADLDSVEIVSLGVGLFIAPQLVKSGIQFFVNQMRKKESGKDA